MEDNIRLCNHCYNTTSHQLIVDGDVKKNIHETNIDGKKAGNSGQFTYFFVKCNTCGDYSLLGCFNDQCSNSKLVDIPVLFPKSNLLDSNVPKEIRRVYEDAAQIKNKIPNAFATQIRLALEYLCKNKKAKGKNLLAQLNSLVEMGIIPPTLNEMTGIIRRLGNMGAHAEDNVSLSDAKDIDDFFRFIIEYVYVAPAKLSQVMLNLEIRRLESEYGNLFDEIRVMLINIDPSLMDENEEGPPSYMYEAETVEIVKKLKDLHSKTELLDYVCKELDFSFGHPIEADEFISRAWDLWEVWNLWNKYKNK